MGPLQHDSPCLGAQAPLCHARSRECLLAECGRRFTPRCARSCYCSEECRRAAREWSGREAQQRYRSSEKGRARRREQSRRWRERRREKESAAAEKGSGGGSAEQCEGHAQESRGKKIRCHRPGCYASVTFSARSPLQRFCCSSCRKALRRARLREARWRGVCAGCPLQDLDLCPSRARSP